MLGWALAFLTVALDAGVMGVLEVAHAASNIATVLFTTTVTL